ncbi:biliverdin-producing heme oxygenase [Sphingobacterium alkalisoli]|uniref:Biliverdin-producing heme oxygenase n=1 Tax=Sphingobacterium alkalisoli TaxID=1874115 RepID=A0A4U0GXK4_9SPHI|nr:biliverdin-producing heme oxygenase [Sphingobacterium alkalisoli]TJY63921.1 biliverdin-producing heme oxygenase [Sphingobacterium alkalisoli]GGH24045.1 heme oxygenase [Sphingobacterium alkalisoli]
MLSQNIKESTGAAHQKLEGTVVRQLKAIRSNADYAEVLKNFYAYFNAVEKSIAPYMTIEVLPDYADRRNSSHIKQDIEELGGSVDNLPKADVPVIKSTLEALSALYVLEGSIMGGPYIVQMLNKYGITEGTSFFSGYGTDTGKMWGAFTAVLNIYGEDTSSHARAIEVANETFSKFGDVFSSASVA